MFELTEVEVKVEETENNQKPSSLETGVNRRVTRIRNLSKQYELLSKENICEPSQKTLETLIHTCANLLSYVKNFAVCTGQSNCIENVTKELVHCEIWAEDSIYHIKYDNLLPKRTKKYSVENDILYMPYVTATHEAAQSVKLSLKDERVVVVFIHHFKDERSMIDYDNFDIKAVVDAIAVHYLPDDSPKWCSFYMDYDFCDMPYTEILLIPQKQYIDYMKNFYEEKRGVP